MAESPILGLPQVAPSQNQKEQVVNTAIVMLEAALNDSMTHDLTDDDVTALARELNGYFLHIATGNSAARTLTFPAQRRLFAVRNDGDADLTVAMASSTLTVPSGMTFLIQADGATLTKIGSNNSTLAFTHLSDTPVSYTGQALKYLRVKADETGIDFVASASVVSGISDFETEYTTTSPTAPTTGLELFTRKRAGRNVPVSKNALGTISELQFSLHSKNLAFVQANGSGTTVFGFTASTAGTHAAGTVDYTTFFKSIRRTKMTTAASASAVGSLYTGSKWVRRGTGGDPAGGFFFVCRFGLETYTAGMAAALGLWDVASPVGTSNPSAQLANNNGIILFKDSTDTNWKIGRAAGGSVTTTDLGATYPANTSATDFFELRLYCAGAGGDVFYALHRLNTGDITEGSFSTTLPTSALLTPFIMNTTRALTSAVSLAFSSLYLTTDY